MTLRGQEFSLISLLKGVGVSIPECEFHSGKLGPTPAADATLSFLWQELLAISIFSKITRKPVSIDPVLQASAS